MNNSVKMSEEVRWQREKDKQVIEALKRTGSNMKKPHMIEHHFITPSRENAQQLADWGKKNGFQVSEVLEGEYEVEKYWYFDLIKPTVPTIGNISEDTSLMLHLANRFNCEYDGWGCMVEK